MASCSVRPMRFQDLEKLPQINIDRWTETFNTTFYSSYLHNFPECCAVAETLDGCIAGYIVGKVEGTENLWHSHISALSVAVEFRRTGVARKLMKWFEKFSGPAGHDCFFADLFVRQTNELALKFYQSLGYVTFRIVTGYYSGEEDAYDMRKPLQRDEKQQSIANAGKRVDPDELEW